MKKVLSLLLVCIMLAATSATCFAAGSDEIVNGKFVETKHITVEVFDRGNEGGSKPEDNVYTDFIKAGLLQDHNIDVTFVPVPRWTEVEQLNNLLAAGDAPDVCVTYSYPTIQTYANMGGVLDLSAYLEQNKDLFPNLWDFLGEAGMLAHKDPETGDKIWAIEARLFHLTRICTFVREDWLKKLDIAAPTNMEEFEAMLKAFKDNAETLLGADADKMIPFSTSFDVGWRADHITASFVPSDITDRDLYVNGFDDRHMLYPNYKEGIRKLNQWYNEGLVWKDFALYPAGDTTEDNLMKSGYVGAFIHNWDYPYRNAENGIQYALQTLIGPEAGYIAINPFPNDAGAYKKFLSSPVADRKVFFPATNDEPLASLMYLDWIATFENRNYLQIGDEGVTHETLENGSVKTIAAKAPQIMNSPNNIDYTIIINGLDMGDPEKTLLSLANGYAFIDSRYIQAAYDATLFDGYIVPFVNVGEIKSEEGMGPALKEKRDALLDQAVAAKSEEFDAVYDAGMADYLASGGQAIIDERAAAWDKYSK